MLLIKPSFEILSPVYSTTMLLMIEEAGRTCYKSKSGDTKQFIHNLLQRGHHSVLEHQSISVKIICDRGISHEIVRHRIAAYSQESTRFCNYANKGVCFIIPNWCNVVPKEYTVEWLNKNGSCIIEKELSVADNTWFWSMAEAERNYLELLDLGWQPQQARSVLPNSLKTELIMTQNLRQWRHFFAFRALGVSGKPHPQMLELTIPMLKEFQKLIPVVFDDLNPNKEE